MQSGVSTLLLTTYRFYAALLYITQFSNCLKVRNSSIFQWQSCFSLPSCHYTSALYALFFALYNAHNAEGQWNFAPYLRYNNAKNNAYNAEG